MQNEPEATSPLLYLAYFYVKTGQSAEAEKIYAELKDRSPEKPPLAFDLTVIGYALGTADFRRAHFFPDY